MAWWSTDGRVLETTPRYNGEYSVHDGWRFWKGKKMKRAKIPSDCHGHRGSESWLRAVVLYRQISRFLHTPVPRYLSSRAYSIHSTPSWDY